MSNNKCQNEEGFVSLVDRTKWFIDAFYKVKIWEFIHDAGSKVPLRDFTGRGCKNLSILWNKMAPNLNANLKMTNEQIVTSLLL